MVKVLDCCFEVSKFKLQSSYYVYFQTEIFEQGLKLLYQMISLLFYKNVFGIKWPPYGIVSLLFFDKNGFGII